jgi:hypothetical protein
MYHSRRYPESWVWLRDGQQCTTSTRPGDVHVPVLACVRTVAIAVAIAHRMGIADPIVSVRNPYDRALVKSQWWDHHPQRGR